MLNVPSLNYSLVQAFLIPTMASSSLQFLLIILGISFVVFVSDSQTLFKPNNLMLLTHKDGAANLHVARISKRTPQTPLYFAVDLNGRFLWVNCEKNYVSSTYRAPRCHSTQCSRANSQYCHKCSSKARPGCHNNTCGLMSANPVTHQNAMGEVAQDMLSIQSTRGSNPGPVVMIPQFLFVCAPSRLLQLGIPIYVQGFVDGGLHPRASVVVGAHQLEDNLVQFDLARSRLGFSSSLLSQRTSCANFNFTQTP
ncbi:basic 7S globulin, putative [Ricinus communis]|uniref:Basic 7S globulin, putative n=1 Tax=Ricinus communis TaxID=3988 RepID=B9RF32_RICCO|nr:basic 7S globulin, putative [Ricinus communis]